MAIALGACAPARLAVPRPLSDTPRLAVKGRLGDQRSPTLSMGPWTVHEVQRSWTRGTTLTVGGGAAGLALDRATQAYAFRITSGDGATMHGTCRAVFRHDGVVLPLGVLASDEQARLDCDLASSGDVPWRMVIRQSFDRAPAGMLVRGVDTVRVTGVDRFVSAVGVRGLLAGWVIYVQERPVAAVEVANAGAVWLDRQAPVRTWPHMGAALAALLLHEDLRQVIPRTLGP